ncbi:SfnB family sulfur acquisition oxidoreductase [Oxalobacteraceae bacterium GrIS 1.11]
MNSTTRLTSLEQVSQAAKKIASIARATASNRDATRASCIEELNAFSNSGLWAITIPANYGGPDFGYQTLSEMLSVIAAADPSLAQIPRSHYHVIDLLKVAGSEYQKDYFFGEILNSKRFSQAASERGGKNAMDINTMLTKAGDKFYLSGKKFYTTGCLYADWIAVVAKDESGNHLQAFVRRNATGLHIDDDWSGFGQRTTASGTMTLERVEVDPKHIMPFAEAFAEPTMIGAASQLIHASIDAGIAREAINEAIEYVRTKSRPWADSGVSHAADDPYIIRNIGDLEVRQAAATATLEIASRKMDLYKDNLDEDTVAEISIKVAIAKILTTETAILATNKLFEVSGASATLEKLNLDRHWRNARVHTLHDPIAWKYNAIGNYFLNEIYPRKHNYI